MGNIKDFEYDISKVLQKNESKNLRKWIKDTKCKCTFECATAANMFGIIKMFQKFLYQH